MSEEIVHGICCQCGKSEHADGSPVSWRCIVCKRNVCRDCTLTRPGRPVVYYSVTLCSAQCQLVGRTQEMMLGDPHEMVGEFDPPADPKQRDHYRQCPTCLGAGRDPSDKRPRCKSRRGFPDRRCELPMGHNTNHFNKWGSMLLSWSTDEKDCACGKRLDHADECAPKDPGSDEFVVQEVEGQDNG